MSMPRLFLFSPLPPAQNGIADYAARIIEQLAARYQVSCIIADDAPETAMATDVEVLTLSAYRRLGPAISAERHLFQLGNNSGHAWMLPWLERISGVVTIHDPSLTHLLNALCAGGWQGPSFATLTKRAHGAAGLALLEAMRAGNLWSPAVGPMLDFLKPVVANARRVIVHSLLARRRVLAAVPDARVDVIPHFAAVPSSTISSSRSKGIRMLCMGFVARAKRIDVVLGVMEELLRQGTDIHLTIVGQARVEEYDVEADIQSRGLAPHVTLTGYVESDVALDDHLQDCDLVLNLRDPSYGETSGTLMRALAAGRCVVVTDVGAYAELPDDHVVKIPGNDMTVKGVLQRIMPVVCDAELRQAIGARGQAFVKAKASLKRVGDAYHAAIEAAYTGQAPSQPSGAGHWTFIPAFAASAIESVAGSPDVRIAQLWWRERLLPNGAGCGRLLIVGGDQTAPSLAKSAFGWEEVDHSEALPEDVEPGRYGGILVLLDRQLAAQIASVNEMLRALPNWLAPSGVASFEAPQDDVLPNIIRFRMNEAGLVELLSRDGPRLPLLNGPNRWAIDSWGASYGQISRMSAS